MIRNNSYQIILAIVIIAMSITSCSEGSFTKVVDLDIEEVDSQLAVIARMNTHSDANLILVSETISVLDNASFESLDDAQVTLTTPDAGDIQWTFNPDFDLYSMDPYEFIPGETYQLEVNHPAHTPMTAEMTVPSRPEMIDLDFRQTDSIGLDIGSPDFITITFQDPPNEENNYIVRGRKHYQVNNSGADFIAEYRFDLSNNILEFNEDIVSDITFDGDEHELVLVGYPNSSTSVDLTLLSVEIELVSLSPDYVLYDLSVGQAYDAEDNPFVEPSTIYSNFDHGFGIFSVDVVESIKLDF